MTSVLILFTEPCCGSNMLLEYFTAQDRDQSWMISSNFAFTPVYVMIRGFWNFYTPEKHSMIHEINSMKTGQMWRCIMHLHMVTYGITENREMSWWQLYGTSDDNDGIPTALAFNDVRSILHGKRIKLLNILRLGIFPVYTRIIFHYALYNVILWIIDIRDTWQNYLDHYGCIQTKTTRILSITNLG